jgi:hypothetical protein
MENKGARRETFGDGSLSDFTPLYRQRGYCCSSHLTTRDLTQMINFHIRQVTCFCLPVIKCKDVQVKDIELELLFGSWETTRWWL